MKTEVKLPVLILAGIVVVALIVVGIMKAMKAGDLDQGQVQYTPGVPPWLEKDPNKKGPGTTLSGNGPGAPSAPGAQAPGGPPGMAGPTGR